MAHFYNQLSSDGEAPPAELVADFARHDWPGNVRELRAAVERTVLLGDPTVWRELSDDAPLSAAATTSIPASEDPRFAGGISFRVAKERAVGEWERDYVRALVGAHDGNLSRAARSVFTPRCR